MSLPFEPLHILTPNYGLGAMESESINLRHTDSGATIVNVRHFVAALLDEVTGITHANIRSSENFMLPRRLYLRNTISRRAARNAYSSLPVWCVNDPDALVKFIGECKLSGGTEDSFNAAIMDPTTSVGAARLRYLYLTRPKVIHSDSEKS